ncbi:glycoside hydrolase family 27 protein [Novosphingobium terrae]|uniref:glycoside hydrolase family 27 protein n=1 Tax=Novosphingobium terrae TaxID=2726189 RepID=UPI00197F2563|nr:glycoside hydrolase family 27 protein [Novosphingobium terrae]
MLSRAFGTGLAAIAALAASPVVANPADNHRTIAATPPMGWNPFNAFRLNYDESTVMAAAEALVQLGLKDDGYRYVNIDDGWWLRRDAGGITIRTNLYPSARLPDGTTSLKPFVDRLHAMGLKAGIYTDIGYNICSQRWEKATANLPEGNRGQREVGSLGHQLEDARAFSAWGFDLVKVDACGIADFGADLPEVMDGTYRPLGPIMLRERPGASDIARVEKLYADFAAALRKARPANPLLLSICAWGDADVNNWAGSYGQMSRTSSDINASWGAMLHNFDSAAVRPLFAGPGHWNDPDMLEVGNGDFDGNHLTEARAHMSLWAMIAAPLVLGFDLTRASPDILAVVRNRDVIAIDQDPAGNQGVIIAQQGDGQIIAKALATRGHKALAFVNRGDGRLHLSVPLADLNLSAQGVHLRDLWHGRQGTLRDGVVSVDLAPRETALLRIEARPIEAKVSVPADMPARIHVTEAGYLPPDRITRNQWVPARIGFLPSGTPITFAGRQETASIGVGAGAHLMVDLRGEFRRLSLAPEHVATDAYVIKVDGKAVPHGPLRNEALDLDLKGARQLELIAPAAKGEGASFIWHNLRFERQ